MVGALSSTVLLVLLAACVLGVLLRWGVPSVPNAEHTNSQKSDRS